MDVSINKLSTSLHGKSNLWIQASPNEVSLLIYRPSCGGGDTHAYIDQHG